MGMARALEVAEEAEIKLLISGSPFASPTQTPQPPSMASSANNTNKPHNLDFQQMHHLQLNLDHHHHHTNQISFGGVMMQPSSSSSSTCLNPTSTPVGSYIRSRDAGGYDLGELDQALFLYLDGQPVSDHQHPNPSSAEDQRQNSGMRPPTLNIFPSQPMHVDPSTKPRTPSSPTSANYSHFIISQKSPTFMAISFQSHVVSDLCLGKPALKSITLTSSVSDALSSLKSSDDTFISIWTSNNLQNTAKTDEIEFECKCVGKISMVDILCFLCKDENLSSPVSALHSPVSSILTKPSDLIKHVDPSTSLLDAIGLILQGAENLIVPIQPAGEYCWLTQEDLIRFILSRIGLFASLLTNSIEDLGIIKTEISALDYNSPASLAMDILQDSLTGQTSVPVVNAADGNNLVGEISQSTLAGADESTTAAIAALSCGDFMAYIDSWGGPPKDLIKLVKSRLKGSNFEGLLIFLDDEYSSTSDDDVDSTSSSSSSSIKRSRRHSRSGSNSFKTGRRAEEMTCHPWSSLVAVMIQAIAHRVNYGWVVDENYGLCGIVTFCDILRVFYEHMKPELEEE